MHSRTTATVLSALSVILCSCAVATKPPTVIPQPILVERELTIPSTKKGLIGLSMIADWEHVGDRYCVSNGDVQLRLPSGPVNFDDASLCVTTNPVSIEGEAAVRIPGIGFLQSIGGEGEVRRATIKLALGSQLQTLAVGNSRLKTNPYYYYLFLRYHEGLSLKLGNASVESTGGSATLIVAPQEPLFYLAADMQAPMFPQKIEGVAIGISAEGRLPFRARRSMPGGGPREITGHLLIGGKVPVPGYPIAIDGELVVDVDANRDGQSVFQGQLRDFRYGINGAMHLGYSVAGFDLSIMAGDASVVYDARPGLLGAVYFSTASSPSPFAGTPLAFLGSSKGGFSFEGYYRALNDFSIQAKTQGKIGGFAVANTKLVLDNRGIRMTGRLKLPGKMGRVDVTGSISPNGAFSLTGKANIVLGGFKIAAAKVTLSNSGVAIGGVVALPRIGNIRVSGSVQSNGQFALSGRGDLRPAGIKLIGAKASLHPKGVTISGSANMLVGAIKVKGLVTPRSFSLRGGIKIDLVVFRGRASATISNRSVQTLVDGKACIGKACVPIAGVEVDTRGRICPVFPVLGKKCIKIKKK